MALQKNEVVTVIKMIGIGSCGGNAINYLIEQGLQGVEFISIDTDAQALNLCKASTRLQIGATLTQQPRAGSQPSVDNVAAEDDLEHIKLLIGGADIVFIAVGMEGDTGTCIAPIVAKLTRELNILTLAIVAKPVVGESKCISYANEGIHALLADVDSLIIVPNAMCKDGSGSDVAMPKTFSVFHDEMQGAVRCIVEAINKPGLLNIDVSDLRTIMSRSGLAVTGSAIASGQDRAQLAAERVIASTLVKNINTSFTRGVLINITSSNTITLKELMIVLGCISCAAREASVTVCSVFEEAMEDELRVTIVATGRVSRWGDIKKISAPLLMALQ